MSGANNIPLGHRAGGGGSLSAAASSLSGISLLNPSYLSGSGGPPPESSGSGRRSKFGPPVDGKIVLVLTASMTCNFFVRYRAPAGRRRF